MLIATGVMTCASVAPVMAATTVADDATVNVGKKAEVNVGENAKVNVNKDAELTVKNGAKVTFSKNAGIDFENGAKVKLGKDAKVDVDKQIAIGINASAKGGDSVAVGNGAEAKGANGVAIGYKSLSGDRGWGVAVGGNTQATGTFSVALGQTAKAIEVEGIVIGHTSLSEGSGAIAIGMKTNAKGAASLAFGNEAKALEQASIAFGQGSNSNGNASIAVGRKAKATGENSIAIGNQAVAAQANSVVIGAHTYDKTTGIGVTGVGQQTQVLGDHSTAFGMAASANKYFTSAIGSYAKATADCANAFGSNSTASAAWSVALGTNSVADRTSGYVGLYAPEDTNSLTWIANGGAVSVGSNGTLTRQITNVAAGTEDTDAVNVAQLKNAGWNLSTGKEITNPTKVKSGATVDFSGDDENITVSREETDFATLVNVKLNRNLNVDSVNAGDYFMGAEKGIGFGGEAYITQSGLNANDKVITNVAAGVYNTDAVNVGQLKEVEEVAANANKGWDLSTNGVATEATNVAPGEIVDFSGDKNISVSHDKTKVQVELNKDLVDIESISNGDAKMALNGAAGTAGMINGKGASVYMQDGYTVINSKVAFDQNGKISGVAAGVADTDAVNVSQLKNSAWKLAANGVLTEAEDVKADDYVDFNGDQNVSVSKDAKDGVKTVKVELSKDLKDIESISNGDAKMALNGAAGTAGMINGKGASVYMQDGYTVINSKVAFDQNGKISGVAAGVADTDAVNVGQLKAVGTTANMGWNLATNGVATEATNVKPGDFVDFSGDKNISVSHDGTKVQVELNKDLVGIESISNGDAKMALNGAAGTAGMINGKGASIYMQDGYTVINSKVAFDQNGKISGVAAGEADTDAVNVGQLKNSAWKLAANGVLTEAEDVKAGDYVDFNGDQNISVSKDAKDGVNTVKVELNKDLVGIESISNGDAKMALNGAAGTAGMINGKGASIYMQDGYTVINSKVAFDQNGKISGVAAGAITADSTDAVNGSQLHAVATEAGKHSKVVNGSNINVEEFDNDGQKIYKVNLNKDIMLGDLTGKYVNISGTNGTIEATGAIATKDRVYADKGGKLADIDVTGDKISNGASSIVMDGSNVKVNDKVTIDQNGKISGVAAGVADTDAVNVGQLKEAVEAGNTDTHIKPGEYGVGADNTVNMDVVDKNGNKVDTVTIKDVAKASDVGNVNNIASDIKNQDGSHTTVVDAVNNLNNKLDNKVGDLNYVEGGKGNYVTNGENTTTSIGKLDQALKDVADTANQGWNLSTNGGEASKVAPGKTVDFSGDKNINISNDGNNVKVGLNKDIKVDTVTANTVTTGQTVMNNEGVKVGADVSLNQNGLNVGKDVSVTATAVTAGKTSISDEGLAVGPNTSLKADELKVDGKTYIDKNGLNANGMQITNVADGKENSDAVNVGQLKKSETTINNRIDGVENQVVNNTNRINKLGSRVNKVGAGAAALAALHPMDFDPDDKLTFSAGYGNYAGENAAAIGAYYRPDEKVMFSVAGTVGNGENMVNAGVSFALDRTNHVSNSRTALAREVIDLRGQLAVMGAKMAKMEKAFGMLDETKTKLFPDVPANHWAYEYIAKLAGNGYIEGYPDGNFGGDRLMTRYEFAAMLYRAIENGAALEEKIIKEFEPELGRIRVDRISGEDGDRDKIERVRVNDTKGERDHYGNKLAK